MEPLEQLELVCLENDKTIVADILSMSERTLKVAVVGTDVTILMHRSKKTLPYVGRVGGLEFQTTNLRR